MGSITGVIKGDTRSVDYSSHGTGLRGVLVKGLGLRDKGLGFRFRVLGKEQL